MNKSIINYTKKIIISSLTKRFDVKVPITYREPNFKELLGISNNDLMNYIESLFHNGMSWFNHGRQTNCWQLDHTKAIHKFDQSKLEDRIVCWHYTNLAPLWYEDHKKKSLEEQRKIWIAKKLAKYPNMDVRFLQKYSY